MPTKSEKYPSMDFQTILSHSGSLLDILSDCIISMNPDGHILHINQQAISELCMDDPSVLESASALYIQDMLSLIHEGRDILPGLLIKIKEECSDKVSLPGHVYIQNKLTGTLFPVKGHFSALRENDHIRGLILSFQDITGELSQEYIINTALVKTKIYPWFFDIEKSEFVLDPRYFEYLNLPSRPGNMLSLEEYMELVHPDDRPLLTEGFAIQLSGEEKYEKPVSFRLRRGDGQWEWFEGQSTYMGNLSGMPRRLIGICMSIQQHKDIENTLLTARIKAEESDMLKSAFLANMSHEIRTPLNAIVGFSELLTHSFEELNKEDRDNFSKLINKNCDQLLALINDILDLSQIESGSVIYDLKKTDLNSLLKEVYDQQLFHNRSEVRLELDIPPSGQQIMTDRSRLSQLINILAGNALKFTEKGMVRIGYFVADDNTVHIYVKDTGTGIAAEDLPRIFDRFYKANSFKPGTGLGLSICKVISQFLQGEISVSSKPNEGSCFTLSLPIYTEMPAPVENRINILDKNPL